MDCTSLERLIIDALPTTLPCKIAYVLPHQPRGEGFLMWDAQYLCAADQTLNPRRDKKDWKKMLINVMSKEGVSEHLTMRKPDDPKHWQGYLMTTNAFLFFVGGRADQTQDDAILDMYTGYMRNICGLAMEVIPIDSVEVIPINPPLQLACGRDGCVRGFSAWIKAQKQHGRHVVDAMRLDWAYLKARGLLARGFADGDYHLADVFVFLTLMKHARRKRSSNYTGKLGCRVDAERKSVLQPIMRMLGSKVDEYIHCTYRTLHNVHAAPPALDRSPLQQNPRRSLRPEEIWDMLCQARENSISIRAVVGVRQNDPHVKCGVSQSAGWINALGDMYDGRRYKAFRNHTHLCLGADASVHSIGDDCLLSIAWTWEGEVASFGDFQFLKPTNKGITLGNQDIDMYDDIAVLIAKKKATRMATYRQVQGISHIISSLTHQGCNIDSYELPPNVLARPAKQKEFRVVVPYLEGTELLDRAVFVDRESKEMTACMPKTFKEVRQLILCEDQGAQCTAMAAFTKADHTKVILYKWD